jgi:hypothetical protein
MARNAIRHRCWTQLIHYWPSLLELGAREWATPSFSPERR